jgi:hypothetical protein
MSDSKNYIPGKCNIGEKEIELRRRQGILGAVISIVLIFTFILFPFNNLIRLVLFFPALLGFLGFFQSREKFCVQYGFLGLFNFEKRVGVTTKVEEKYISQDRIKASFVILKSILLASLLTVLVYLF